MSGDASTYYSVTHADEFRPLGLDWPAFYRKADAETAEARRLLHVERDIRYGPLEKQRLDLYLPERDDPALPVLVFLHGGGFREGDRAHYGFVALPFATRGIPTVVPSYRLLPGSGVADALRDAVAAIVWTAARYPGRRIVAAGHSAGGILAARIGCARTELLGPELDADTLAGVIPISSSYDLTNDLVPDYLRESFAGDAERRRASPLHALGDCVPRAVIAVGGRETSYHAMAEQLSAALRGRGSSTETLVLGGLGHDETVFALTDPASPLFLASLALLGARHGSPTEAADGIE